MRKKRGAETPEREDGGGKRRAINNRGIKIGFTFIYTESVGSVNTRNMVRLEFNKKNHRRSKRGARSHSVTTLLWVGVIFTEKKRALASASICSPPTPHPPSPPSLSFPLHDCGPWYPPLLTGERSATRKWTHRPPRHHTVRLCRHSCRRGRGRGRNLNVTRRRVGVNN